MTRFAALIFLLVALPGWGAITERYVTSGAAGGGDGSSGSPWTLAEAAANAVAGDRVNIKADGTYTLGADLTWGSGTQAAAIWVRGYKTTIGDGWQGRDATGEIVTTNMPVVSCGTNLFDFGSYVILESLNITSARTSTCVGNSVSDNLTFFGCQFISTGSNALVINLGGDNEVGVFHCDFHSTGATIAALFDSDIRVSVYGCRFTTASTTVTRMVGLNSGVVLNSLLDGGGVNTSGVSYLSRDNLSAVCGNTFYNIGGVCVTLANAIQTGITYYFDNHITDCAKFIDDLREPTANQAHVVIGNRTRDNTSPSTGIGDWPNGYLDVTTDNGAATDDFVSPSTGNFFLKSNVPGYAASLIPYSDIGAYQHEDPESEGGGGTVIVYRGNMFQGGIR